MSRASSRPLLRIVRLGLIPYAEALQEQQRYVQALKNPQTSTDSEPKDTLLLCEHPAVYTVGIRQGPYPAQEENRLQALGADFQRTDRGGLITFHGPGQLVCYPILDLRHIRRSLRLYVCGLEETAIRLCQRLGIQAKRTSETGVWVRDRKICAIGVHCARHITSHGLAMNCNTDLTWFDHIVPCGIKGKGVTSLTQELSRNITVEETIPSFVEAFQEEFKCNMLLEDALQTTNTVLAS
ncbi:putative lipoyltransferase 2, mitochondrial [Bombina bombina]|uniref:putative lipoyltransferase 2, mitochondrial n=1 Tax=Bombina bombina TaxID=8345 RepID=UPI00235B0C60|nr:putative lipoyltransferase 2, mitochondrial [Bombina bombina]XP_053561067.1 putative lipoyltransferase 2, mitochondrial [Bombina bombina]XP_053561068.1 putative lipoyltransferase 2, mitochondrial [Bombina bombina]XP_053561069.1 putative lipoyltransferase 2, mitochondrial [Bombina bombina]XP_053561070.1 putative lipoyltransferase 2, mitochondrial [Bombina bombina]